MGTFIGHVFPGSVVITMGLWWSFNIFYDFYKSQSTGKSYTARVSYNCPCERGLCTRIPLEAVVKTVFLIGGIYVEVGPVGIPVHGLHGVSIYHLIVYSVFLLVPLVDILLRCKVALPPMVDHVVLGLAFVVNFLIMYHHALPTWNPLRKILHRLLAFIIASIAITIFTEIRYKNSFLVSFARAYFTCLYGTWFWQMAFVMFKPASPWNAHSDSTVPLIVTYFCGHMAVDFVILIMIGWVIRRVVVRCYGHKNTKTRRKQDDDLEECVELLQKNGDVPTLSR